ncbi:thioredoxin family protein [Pseudalkalibacillus berkeleyi]|uniref:Thioredoxin family protein n=1 Tax=Pseudalkalibacillus berkeleyi TaxID=1069813 RepID=A0ABS9H0T6_9BACL|nr:thioredoxin family protein [Pseudalkalibacillus berkeleyi]MCF6137260.1 thioredoxin family protein [Pseudalkalibacillus berkeleyi]
MKEITHLQSITAVDQFIATNQMSFIYVTRTNCSVCHALLPRVREMLNQYENIHLGQVNADDVTEIAGHFSIFTVPVLLLFVEGKEMIREARFVQIEALDTQIGRIYEMNT